MRRATRSSASAERGEVSLNHLEVLAEPIELAQMPLHCEALIRREDLLAKPCAALRSAEVLMWARRDQCACRIDCMMFFSRVRCRKI